jgi:hypothetical protein
LQWPIPFGLPLIHHFNRRRHVLPLLFVSRLKNEKWFSPLGRGKEVAHKRVWCWGWRFAQCGSGGFPPGPHSTSIRSVETLAALSVVQQFEPESGSELVWAGKCQPQQGFVSVSQITSHLHATPISLGSGETPALSCHRVFKENEYSRSGVQHGERDTRVTETSHLRGAQRSHESLTTLTIADMGSVLNN